jgi:hypothetical protein
MGEPVSTASAQAASPADVILVNRAYEPLVKPRAPRVTVPTSPLATFGRAQVIWFNDQRYGLTPCSAA